MDQIDEVEGLVKILHVKTVSGVKLAWGSGVGYNWLTDTITLPKRSEINYRALFWREYSKCRYRSAYAFSWVLSLGSLVSFWFLSPQRGLGTILGAQILSQGIERWIDFRSEQFAQEKIESGN